MMRRNESAAPRGGAEEPRAGEPAPTRPALDVAGVCKSSGGTEMLRDVSVAAAAGESVAVVGASGSGKTTLLRVIAGFEVPESGTVRAGDRVFTDGRTFVPAHKRGIGFVPQDGALFPHLTVAGNIGFGLERRDRTRERIAALLERVALPAAMASRRPDQLSGGQQQRVALARALAQSPRIVLLDEPFSALDAGLRAEIRAGVAQVLRDADVTAVLVTHDHEEALSFADTVVVLRDGRVAQAGSPREVYLRPADDATAAFFGEEVRLPGERRGSGVATALGTVAFPPGDAVPDADACSCAVALRTEQLVFVDPSSGRGAPGVVRDVAFLGATVRCVVAVEGVGDVVVRCRPHAAPAPGDAVALVVEGEGRLCAGVGRAEQPGD